MYYATQLIEDKGNSEDTKFWRLRVSANIFVFQPGSQQIWFPSC